MSLNAKSGSASVLLGNLRPKRLLYQMYIFFLVVVSHTVHSICCLHVHVSCIVLWLLNSQLTFVHLCINKTRHFNWTFSTVGDWQPSRQGNSATWDSPQQRLGEGAVMGPCRGSLTLEESLIYFPMGVQLIVLTTTFPEGWGARPGWEFKQVFEAGVIHCSCSPSK